MKTETLNTPVVSAPDINVAGYVKALTEQVNNLQSRYYSALAPDCEVRTTSDRWYFRAIGFTSFGLIFVSSFIGGCLLRLSGKEMPERRQ